MPALELQIQPDGNTLVNVDTIFYTDATVLRRTVALLGHSVRLEATPVRFTWVHGDGTSASTSKAGRPYPAKDVTHRYEQPGRNLSARVDTTYQVRYSVDGGGWAGLDETLTARGPATTLDVDEAAPVLTR
ncbi:MAG: PKD domain-containing protein [Aeromicrobium sp.]